MDMQKASFVAFVVIATLLFAAPAAAVDYGKVAIIAGGSALACGVVADVLSEDDDKAGNAWKAALLCGGIGAAYGASDSYARQQLGPDEDIRMAAEEEQQNRPKLNLLLTKERAGVLYRHQF